MIVHQPFTSQYLYHLLSTKSAGDSVDRIGTTLFNSKIKLTPHQIDAALFAFKSPMSKGCILADEVGLGKTIEAGIILAQLWNEHHRRLLIVSPASLMRQWGSELEDKFNLPSLIMDRKNYNRLKKEGNTNPYILKDCIIICSYQMCSMSQDDIKLADFDLCIIDEAHKLRNVWTGKNTISNGIKYALSETKKVLLTATPIQNNVMDFYGLSSLIDDNLFGDVKVFKEKYYKNYNENLEELRERLGMFTHRTLREQVQQYVKFTQRIPKTFMFEQNEDEIYVYNKIRELLLSSEEDSYLIPNKQKHLMLLILCKLMGSSMHSIVGTLETMKQRLIHLRDTGIDSELDIEIEDDIEDLYSDAEMPEQELIIDVEKINIEINNLEEIIESAKKVNIESKYVALKESIAFGRSRLSELKANDKVLIFTESRRTQSYLFDALTNDGFEDVILFNGSNNDAISTKIYDDWVKRPENHEKLNNSKSINMRQAIVDYFKTSGKILIATGAGAEGLNLQFCSLVINYDLPWNPQIVEQRIGRCHRFGQINDVVVINFLSQNNIVEQRVYELLSSKFRVFNEVLGSSDSILGTLDEGIDLEKSIIDIYTKCRTENEINAAFDIIQDKYRDTIAETIDKTKQELIDNFDEDLQKYFTGILDDTKKYLGFIEETFWRLSKNVLFDVAIFSESTKTFTYDKETYSISTVNPGNYIDYNMSSILGKTVLKLASSIDNSFGYVEFNMSDYPYRIKDIENLIGKKGYISLFKLSIDSFEKEEKLYFCGTLLDGSVIGSDVIEKLFRLDTIENLSFNKNDLILKEIDLNSKQFGEKLIIEAEEKNNALLNAEIIRINSWAEDKIEGVQLKVENMRAERKNLQKQSDIAENIYEKEKIEAEIRNLSKKIKSLWLELADAEEEIEEQRNNMIKKLRQQIMKSYQIDKIFTIEFSVI